MKIVKNSILGLGMGLMFITNTESVSAETAHLVKPGDTLGRIAQQYNTTVDNLVQINNIKNKNHINVGQKIVLSKKSANDSISSALSYFEAEGVMPVEKNYYSITSKYGERQNPFQTSKRSFHYGLDIAAYGINDSNIYSVLPGKVIAATYNDGGYGNYVKIQHSNGVETLYAHMIRTPNVRVGDNVSSGDIIGNVGTTGNSTGPHLHLEVFVNKERYNPEDFLNMTKAWPNSKPKPTVSNPSEQKPVTPSSSNVGGSNIYIVQRGDTLYKIATIHNSTVSEIKSMNGIVDSNIIYVGQKIVTGDITSNNTSGKEFNSSTEVAKEYKIKRGDSLWKIASSNSMTVKELKDINNLKSDLIFVGDILLVK